MSQKKKIVEKKVYKANTKALKVVILVVALLVLGFVLFGPIKNGIIALYYNTWEWHTVEDYNFKFQLPRAFQKVEIKDKNSSMSSSIFTTDTEVQVNEKYVSKLSEIVYTGGNRLNGITMMIEVLKTEKTTKTLDEIAEGQHILVMLNYENSYSVGTMQKEEVNVLETKAVRVAETLTKDKEEKMIVSYLIPLAEEEVTVIFFGEKENMLNAEQEISKIISQMKLINSK